MKLTILSIALCVSFFTVAQKETDASEWTVTKINNQNQLLNNPNEITVAPDGWLWVTERRVRSGNGESVVRVDPSSGTKEIMLDLRSKVFSSSGQDGLMGMAIHPSLFTASPISTATDPYVYVAYTYSATATTDGLYLVDGSRRLRIERYTYRADSNDFDPSSGFTLIDDIPASNDHNSGRMKIGPDGKIYYTVGDLGYNQFFNKCGIIQSQSLPTQAEVNNQDYSDYKGKILRMNLDGTIPSDNPTFLSHDVIANNFADYNFSDQTATGTRVRSHIYTYGHRNAQGIIFGSDGTLYSSEHGDRVDDEVNVITPGSNYGWPFIAGYRDDAGFEHCRKQSICGLGNGYENQAYNEYNECDWVYNNGNSTDVSAKYGETLFPEPSNFKEPIANYNSGSSSTPTGGYLTWPSVAPSSIDIYEGTIIPWGKSILIPSLKLGTIYRYELDVTGQNVVGNPTVFHSSIDRYRDIAVSPDGKTIYAIIDSDGTTSGPSASTTGLSMENPGDILKFEYKPAPTLYISEVTYPQDNVEGTFVEIYNYGSTAIDLSAEGIHLGRQRAGNSSDQEGLALTGTINPGQYFVIGRSAFSAIYGSAPDQIGSDALLAGDGNDPYAIVYTDTFLSNNYSTIDTYGVLGIDGTGQTWEYSSFKRASRKRNQIKSSGNNFNINEWNLSSINSESADNSPFKPDPLTFIYASNLITPFDPVGISTEDDNLIVQNGTFAMNDQLRFKTVTIDNGAILEFGSQTLLVAKDFVNNGEITGVNRKVRFTNNGTHIISGNDLQLDNLVTNSDLQVENNVFIANILKVTNGNVTINPSKTITLKSDATATAFVDQVPLSSEIIGNVTIEHYFPAKRAYRFFSSPVTTTDFIYNNWQEAGSSVAGLGTHITGSTIGASGFDATGSGSASLFTFDNSTTNWEAVADTDNTTIIAGKPYRLFLRGDRTIDLTNNNATATATTLRTTGTLKTHQVDITDLNTTVGSFNFIGNPYQSSVDMNLLLERSTGMNKQDVYVWDPSVNDRGAYVTVDVINNINTITGTGDSSSLSVDKFLRPNSAFFVVTTGAGANIAFTEADKEITAKSSVKSTSDLSILKLGLARRENGTTPITVDGALTYFSDSYASSIDYSDSYKFDNQDENLFLMNGQGRLSIDRRPSLSENERLPIGMNNLRGNTYQLYFDASRVTEQLFVFDKTTEIYTELTPNAITTLDFEIAEGADSSTDRFFITSVKSTLSVDSNIAANITLYPNPYKGGQLTINSENAIESMTVVNVLGQKLWSTNSLNNTASGFSIELPASLTTGTYLIHLKTDEGTIIRKLLIE